MIYLFEGLPGSGKSYNAVKWMLEEHFYYDKIYTNIELNIPYVRDKFPDLAKKVVFLTSDDIENLGQFRDGNCAIVIDEIHVWFNSREWQKRNKEFMVFLTQHRKQGVDLIAITQDAKNLDAQMRRLVGVVYSCVNAQQLEVFIVRLPNLFIVRKSMAGIKAGTSFVLLKKRIARCYDTHARVDLDEDQIVKSKKLPLGLKVRRAIIWSKLAKWTSYIIAGFVGYSMIFGGADSSATAKSIKPVKKIASRVQGDLVDVSSVMSFEAIDNVCTGVVKGDGYMYVLYKREDSFGERNDFVAKVTIGSDYMIKSGWLYDGKKKICDVRGFL